MNSYTDFFMKNIVWIFIIAHVLLLICWFFYEPGFWLIFWLLTLYFIVIFFYNFPIKTWEVFKDPEGFLESPYTVFNTICCILFFYIFIYSMDISMLPDTKPGWVFFVEGLLWLFLIFVLFIDFFKFFLNFSLVSFMMNDYNKFFGETTPKMTPILTKITSTIQNNNLFSFKRQNENTKKAYPITTTIQQTTSANYPSMNKITSANYPSTIMTDINNDTSEQDYYDTSEQDYSDDTNQEDTNNSTYTETPYPMSVTSGVAPMFTETPYPSQTLGAVSISEETPYPISVTSGVAPMFTETPYPTTTTGAPYPTTTTGAPYPTTTTGAPYPTTTTVAAYPTTTTTVAAYPTTTTGAPYPTTTNISTPYPTTTTSSSTPTNYTLLENRTQAFCRSSTGDGNNNDGGTNVPNINVCAQKCDIDPQCTAFDYANRYGKNCFMWYYQPKDYQAYTINADSTNTGCYLKTSALNQHPVMIQDPTGYTKASPKFRSYISHNAYSQTRNLNTSVTNWNDFTQQCAALCNNTTGCTSFDLYYNNGYNCELEFVSNSNLNVVGGGDYNGFAYKKTNITP